MDSGFVNGDRIRRDEARCLQGPKQDRWDTSPSLLQRAFTKQSQ